VSIIVIHQIAALETTDPDTMQELSMMALRAKFRPEFLNRIDEFVTFNSLGMEQLVPIVSLELEKVGRRLAERGLSLSATEGAKAWLAEVGH
jgi:ATP-dependent Clp protease ATP-binding subunit ClpB